MYSREILIPGGVNAEVEKNKVKISGSKGSLERSFNLLGGLKIEKKESKIIASSEKDTRPLKAKVGTIIAHARNMIEGVTKGYTYRLRVIYSHFPITMKLDKDKVVFQNFLGERTPRVAKIVGKTEVKIEGSDIIVTGIDIEEVGLTSHNLEQATRRTGFDKKVFQDGCYIVTKGE